MKNKIENETNIHESGEDYLEKILMLTKEGKSCRSVDLAAAFGYSRPAISRAVKVLKDDGFLLVGPKGHLELTPEGMQKAKATLERHLLLTEFFKNIGVDSAIAETDACRVEHILHDETFEKLVLLNKRLSVDDKR